MSKNSAYIALIFMFGMTTAEAGAYRDAIDAQSEVMNQTMRDFGTVQGNIAAYWRNMPRRERYLRSTANKAVDAFKRHTGRYPTGRDQGFVRRVLVTAGVRNQAEAEVMIDQMDSYIRGAREQDAIGNDMCAAARQYSAQGFGHIYRNVMPECFK
ncbi:MAG: hypothetical protein ACPW60_00330 [Methylohalobius sp. ZOD2]